MQRFLLLALAISAPAAAQGNLNDMPLNNGGEVFLILNSPSVAFDPSTGIGDLFWKAFPGDRLLAHEHGPSGAATMEIDGFNEQLFDTDWTTPPPFYDRLIGPAVTSAVAACTVEPAFLSAGITSEVLVSLGNSGFGHPCTIAPSLCSPSGGTCPPPGTFIGYLVDISIGSSPGTGVVVSADGTPASNLAVSYLVPGGMVDTGGTCGAGDYSLQAYYSTDETQADDCFGYSTFGGTRILSFAPSPDLYNETPANLVTFREPILNAQASVGGGALETSENGGGALNALKLTTGAPGTASLGFEVRDVASIGKIGVVWGSTFAGGPPGSPVLGGAYLLVRPDRDIPGCFMGPVAGVTFVFTPEGAFTTCQVPVGPITGPLDFYFQALIYDPASMTAVNTNRLRTTLY